MTTDKTISSVLFVPEEGSDLLAEGLCGARPPALSEWARVSDTDLQPLPETCWSKGPPYGLWMATGRRALVLAWEGEVAVDGCDRLARMLRFAHRYSWSSISVAKWVAEKAQEKGLGTLISLDADRREIEDPREYLEVIDAE